MPGYHTRPHITFHVPPEDLPHPVESESDLSPGDFAKLAHRVISVWCLRTWWNLRRTGFECTLSPEFPDEGIVVAAACAVPLRYQTNNNVLHVSAVADSPPRVYSHLNVFQNPAQLKRFGVEARRGLVRGVHIPHWQQPRLVERDRRRGDTVRVAAYLGAEENAAPFLKSPEWKRALAKRGIEWRMAARDAWDDYSAVDIAVAIRDPGGLPYDHKPASKLTNAWLAGVPALVGPESAYLALKQSGEDMVVAQSEGQALNALTELTERPERYEAMRERAGERAVEFTDETLTGHWKNLLEEVAIPLWERWMDKSAVAKRIWQAEALAFRAAKSVSRKILPGSG